MPLSLFPSLYKEVASTFNESEKLTFSTTIEINAAHAIFHGHFKQMPVMPGVCMIQIFKEIVSSKWQTELLLEEGHNIKFLAMVNPLQHPELTIRFQLSDSETGLLCNATCSTGDSVCVKFKGKFKRITPA